MSLLRRIDHLGIAVHDLDAAIAWYGAVYGVHAWERIPLPERHMEVAVAMVGDAKLELIMPTSDQAAFATFLRERGEGVHHVAYEVDDLEHALRAVEAAGVRLVDAHGRPGIHDTFVGFLHPRSTMGVLTELVQLPATAHDGGRMDG
jgi:methylmalonyl-CoA/ethylmalonyl-CoA epimerase